MNKSQEKVISTLLTAVVATTGVAVATGSPVKAATKTSQAQLLKNAKFAVERAEASVNKDYVVGNHATPKLDYIVAAQNAVRKLSNSATKTSYAQRTSRAMSKAVQQLSQLTATVGTLSDNKDVVKVFIDFARNENQYVPYANLQATFTARLDKAEAALDAPDATEVAAEAAAETAVAAYEKAPLTSLVEATAAEALEAPAKTAVAAVKDAAKNAVFTSRIAAQKAKVDAAKAQFGPLTVSSVNGVNATQVEIKFNKAVDPASLFTDGKSGAFKATVTLTSIDAQVPGTLTGALSEDGKTLTVTAQNALSKRYDVVVDNLLAKDGTSLTKYTQLVTITADTTAPAIVSTTKTSAGTYKVTFSEPLKSLGTVTYKLDDGTAVSSNPTGVTNNFTQGAKEVTFTIGSEVAANKNVTATFVGTQDQAGNLITPNPATASFVKGDKDGVAPTVASITQTGAKTFAVKFSEQLAGNPVIKINNVTVANANVVQDDTDATKYNVTAPTALNDATTIGVESFADLSGETGTNMSKVVSFVKDTVAPKVVSSAVVVDSNDQKEYLEMTFDKDVYLSTPTVDVTSGSYVKNYITNSILDADITAKAVAYKTSTDKKVVRVDLATLLAGKDVAGAVYNLNLTFAGVANGADIAASTATVTFTRGTDGTASNALVVGVTSVTPGADNNKVNVTFDKAVDGASAITTSNYTVDGAVVESVSLQPVAGGTQVAVLNLKAGSNGFTGVRNIRIANVKALGSTKVMDPYFINTVSLKENVAPTITSAKLTALDTITLTFSESVCNPSDGAQDFDLYVGGTKVTATTLDTEDVLVGSAKNTLTLTVNGTGLTAADLAKGLSIKTLDSNPGLNITDAAGNLLSSTTINVAQ